MYMKCIYARMLEQLLFNIYLYRVRNFLYARFSKLFQFRFSFNIDIKKFATQLTLPVPKIKGGLIKYSLV